MTENKNRLQEPIPDYEKAETDLLKEGLKRSFNERFHTMTALMKMSLMFKQVNVKHKPFPAEKK